ncbi:MAG TPA: CRTAC1 family protein [Thermoanaerobaculia bacterium]|nr:CRTAC1 family protein [Thermoanaerobaculia bacterium]
MKPGLKHLLAVSVVLLPALALGAAAPAKAPAKPPAKASSPAPAAKGVTFTDITAASGVKFTHNSGRSGKKYLPESLGSGVALFDADGDGWLDILLINSRDWEPKGRTSLPALYHNNHNGTFTDVTRGSGLAVQMYGMGVAVADYDNDGREDVYITSLDGDRLFHNEGGGKFKDVTGASGIKNVSFGTSAAWVDYDRDGKADLFVANYVQWSRDKDLWCSLDGSTKSYCTPESYKGASSKLYRNLGGGKFEDVSQKAGVGDPTSKSLGIAVLDYNGDGWPDLFVANDTQPNKLYRNMGNGTFKDEALEAGVAFSEEGTARGAMGVDAADYDRSGRPHLLVGNFSNEMLALYHNEGSGVFVDEAPSSTVGQASLLTLSFGVFFFDYDLDGLPDILAANGHLEEEINRVQPRIQYKEPPLLFRNLGKGKFASALSSVGADFGRPIVARGAAYGDLDNDGDLDVVFTTNHGPAVVFRNDGGNGNHWLRVKTVGTKSNRDGLGTVVRVTSAGGKQWTMVRTGSSYCSQSEIAPTFGLGPDKVVQTLELEWPSGTKQRFTNVPANQVVTVDEGKGIVSAGAVVKAAK